VARCVDGPEGRPLRAEDLLVPQVRHVLDPARAATLHLLGPGTRQAGRVRVDHSPKRGPLKAREGPSRPHPLVRGEPAAPLASDVWEAAHVVIMMMREEDLLHTLHARLAHRLLGDAHTGGREA
jgi:hypothetical protein